MHLFIPAAAPHWLVYVHIAGGSAGIVSGAVAGLSVKGSPLHKAAGKLFVAAMLTMAAAATYLGAVIPQPSNFAAGVFTFYLVATAWWAGRRPDGPIGRFERLAAVVPVGLIALYLVFGALALGSPHGTFDRYEPPFYFIAALLMSLPAIADVRLMRRGTLSGVSRIARHLWRMSFALFFASGSFFLGQQKVMPIEWRGSPVLLFLGLWPLALMIFWLARVRGWVARPQVRAATA